MVRCPKGHENPDDYRFCGECGAPLAGEHQTQRTSQAMPSGAHESNAVEGRPPGTEAVHQRDAVQSPSGGDVASGRLTVGDQVRVVNPEDKFYWMVGTVRDITDADHGSSVKVAFKNGTYRYKFLPDEVFAYQPDELKPTSGDDASGQLKVGDEVRVVNLDDKYGGMPGTIREFTNADQGSSVKVAFKDGSYRRTFRPDEVFAYQPNELKVVGLAESQRS